VQGSASLHAKEEGKRKKEEDAWRETTGRFCWCLVHRREITRRRKVNTHASSHMANPIAIDDGTNVQYLILAAPYVIPMILPRVSNERIGKCSANTLCTEA
jgi:hypothetical protein